jgi:gluconate kinase
MSIGPKAIDWVLTEPVPVLLGEGDRLAYDRFLHACARVGEIDLVWIDVPLTVARGRALARADKAQNWTWVKGRFAKVENLVARHRHIRIDGNQLPSAVASELASIIGR